jgi:hypothetical protein
VVTFQGEKTAYVKDAAFHFDAERYLIVAGSLPIDCAFHASPTDPVSGMLIALDPGVLRRVYEAMPAEEPVARSRSQIVTTTPQTQQTQAVVERILAHMATDAAAGLFVDDAIKELYFYLLQGEAGPTLRACLNDGRIARVLSAMEHIRDQYHRPITVHVLAEMCHMSATNFHRVFR